MKLLKQALCGSGVAILMAGCAASQQSLEENICDNVRAQEFQTINKRFEQIKRNALYSRDVVFQNVQNLEGCRSPLAQGGEGCTEERQKIYKQAIKDNQRLYGRLYNNLIQDWARLESLSEVLAAEPHQCSVHSESTFAVDSFPHYEVPTPPLYKMKP